jgi:enoyl-CoA hydratase
MVGYSHYGLEMTKQALRAELEIASLDAPIEIEDRNQLMARFTDNLPEAIKAFDEGRAPVYRDDPRRDLFDG